MASRAKQLEEMAAAMALDLARRTELHRSFWQRDLAQYRELPFIAGIKIECRADYDCPAGRAAEGCYRIPDAPEWPGERCTGEFGCICGWTTIFEDEEPPTPWKTGG